MSLSRGGQNRVHNVQQDNIRREVSYSRRRATITREDAYSYALRTALLHHLLQPRAKRLQHVAAAAKPARQQTSTMDLIKDASGLRDTTKTKLPHAFMGTLDKRTTGVLMGTERMPEYKDALVKRSFGAFLNEFKSPATRKNLEASRSVADLLLIFFAQATKELQKGRTPDDDSWKLMVDRHMALFCRLLSAILKDQDWGRERPQVVTNLATMEKKLLLHDQDLAAESTRNGGAGGYSVEVEVPISYEVKDMPLVLIVSRVFGTPYAQVQDDINARKQIWTAQAALQDLKLYQKCLSLNVKKTFGNEDFDSEEAYESWKKAELSEVSQMILTIVQAHPDLAKTNTNGAVQVTSPHDSGYGEFGRNSQDQPGRPSMHSADSSIDIGTLSLNGDARDLDNAQMAYLPSDPRFCYRAVAKECLIYDMTMQDTTAADSTAPTGVNLLSRDSLELLSEIALRWRIPQSSRSILFFDVMKERFLQREITLDELDAAFAYTREPPALDKKAKRQSVLVHQPFADWKRWPIADIGSYQTALANIHDTLLRDLFDMMIGCYDAKAPSIGPLMYILEKHIYEDELFTREPEELDEFTKHLKEALHSRSAEIYREMLNNDIPAKSEDWQFFNVITLGKNVVKFADKIQKRYRKSPFIMGVNPLMILVEEVFPSYATDARALVDRIMQHARTVGQEIDIQDGFDLYGELVEIRKVHAQVLPEIAFAFHIESLLQEFVWRWIELTDSKIVTWVEEAVRQDSFVPHAQEAGVEGSLGHSSSALDMFRSFKESINQIVDLNWDDDLQYAKFMTALSKSVGKGLARYCELVEQRFVKEMDRLTPEQEAALSRTRQEKWMQLAKDAWANRDKVEPFQFLPESLVKLNNVGYAMLELDKLEKEINVDACAEVIAKHAPPVTQRQRKQESYVFTIKIIEAEDLKACDMNGLSDPYLVLGDEYQKRLAKTRVIYANLNPRWEETVDIMTTGPLNIIATIWDWDAFGEHDCVGRASLKLDPSHFRDYMPREYWLDLDTQGRLLLRVSMEGERDDIQFYFGKAFRTLKRAERDMTRKITDKLSAYIHYCLSRQRLKSLLNRNALPLQALNTVTNYFNRNRAPVVPPPTGPTPLEITNALKPLFNYFNDNFAIMKQTLTDPAMQMVMTRLWKEVLVMVESLLIPPLSDKPSTQKPLTQQEVDIVYRWLQLLFDFFHAVDEETNTSHGVPVDILKSPKYHDLKNLAFFYSEPTSDLIRTSESIASATATRTQEAFSRTPAASRASAPPSSFSSHQFGGAAGLVGVPTKRSKSIMLNRNLGTMRKAKEEKRKMAQAEPSDDIILRILRMRPEAERYIRERSKQKEKLAAAVAAQEIVRQSLAGGSGWGRMGPTLGAR